MFALWTVYAACWVSDEELWSYEHVLWFLLPTAYLLFCAYVTFSSPPKAILFVTGLCSKCASRVCWLIRLFNLRQIFPLGRIIFLYLYDLLFHWSLRG